MVNHNISWHLSYKVVEGSVILFTETQQWLWQLQIKWLELEQQVKALYLKYIYYIIALLLLLKHCCEASSFKLQLFIYVLVV